MKYPITLLLLLQLVYISMANAIDSPAVTLQGNESNAGFTLDAFRGQYYVYEEREHFTNSEVVNIIAMIAAEPEDIGVSVPIYIIAIANGTPYIRINNDQWVPWDGGLHEAEHRTLAQFEYLAVAFGLTGISGDIDIYVGYGKSSGDVVYNKNPLSLIIRPYSKVLTVGEHGQYSGCSGFQTALNIAQDLSEVRVEQGTYHCNGLVIAAAKKLAYGMKVSGGWDSRFQTQTKDPALTIIDGSAQLIQGFKSILECLNGIVENKPRYCFHDDVVTGAILTINTDPVTIEMLTFQNGYSGYRGESSSGAINADSSETLFPDVVVNQCHFNNNTGISGGAVHNVNVIHNSLFINNYATGGGAASVAKIIHNSQFIHNTAGSGGGVYKPVFLINNLFDSNSAGVGGAVFNAKFILNNTFVNNVASRVGGAYSGGGIIFNSVFSDNTAAGQQNDIESNGRLEVDYSLFNHLNGGTDLGLHNVTGKPLFIDSANKNYQLQANSPAINTGNNELLEQNRYLISSQFVTSPYFYDYPNHAGTPIDLQGNSRLQGTSIDMGAYEYQE